MLQVTSPASKGKRKLRCGCSRCNRGLAGSPRVPLRFQLALRAPEGRCSDLTRPFFADTHWEAEPYCQRLFCSKELCELPAWGFQATSQDDSLFPISQVSASSAWARHSETLLTPDCAAAARAGATYHTKATGRVYSLQSTAPFGDCSDAGFLDWQCCSGSLSPDTSLMGKGWVSNAFGRTNVFPDAW